MRHLGSKWNPLVSGANSIDSTDSSTTPRNASDTDMVSSSSIRRTAIDGFIVPQTKPVARQGRNNKRRSTPYQICSRLGSTLVCLFQWFSPVLSCIWTTSTTSDMLKASDFRTIADRSRVLPALPGVLGPAARADGVLFERSGFRLHRNGIPVATVELKTEFTQSITHGE